MSEEEKKAMENDILFQIDMELYDKFNDKFCAMNEYLGEIYSYADLKDLEDSRNATEINLLRQAIKKQQKELEQEKRKNKELKTMYILATEYKKDTYISKDKLREEIEEINNEKLNYSEDEYYLENEIKGYAIDKLKELLEE